MVTKPFRRQLLQRLAQGDAADPQLRRQMLLADRLAALQLAGQDALAHQFGDLVGDGALDGQS